VFRAHRDAEVVHRGQHAQPGALDGIHCWEAGEPRKSSRDDRLIQQHLETRGDVCTVVLY